MAWYHWKESLLYLDLRVQQRARQNEIAGIMGERLRIRIKSPPVDGRANLCLVEWMASEFDVPVSRVELTAGANSRNKRVVIDSPVEQPDWFLALAKPDNQNGTS